MKTFKTRILAASIGCAVAGMAVSPLANALGFLPGFGTHPNKYLIVWNSDQMLDGRNHSPLDSLVGVPAGSLPDADFLAVIDADPLSPDYGKVVNTAEMPVVLDQHLLSETENFVDDALEIVGGTWNGPDNPPDILGDVNGVLAPSSILNEAHHMNVVHLINPTDGSRNIFPAGLISANVFGCDITDPMKIKPAQGTTPDAFGRTNNVCGLAVSGRAVQNFSGTDDLLPFGGGRLIATYMGAKGSFSGATAASLPPTLTTPGGLVEIDAFTGTVVGEYTAIPSAPVPGHGTYVNGTAMLGPERYAPRTQIALGGVDGNGNPVNNILPVGIGPDSGAVDLDAGINEAPDTALLAHPHGIGVRPDLPNPKGEMGIVMASDYADPVSLALTGSGEGPATAAQDLGTTVRFWSMESMSDGPYAIAQMPDGPRHEDNQIHEEPEGLMAMAITNRPGHKGAFVASMCGGALFYSADITVPQPEFKLVYDFGACTGASVFTISRNDRFIIMPISGIQTDVDRNSGGPAAPGGDPIHDRDYPGEHDMRIVTLDIRKLLAAGTNFQCDAAPADKWDNSGPDSPIGEPVSQGPAGVLGHPEHSSGPMAAAYSATGYWPNNGAADCPTIVSVVDFDGDGVDDIPGTADDHPDAETSRGGPHFVVHDSLERYIATSNYFVDLREFAIAGVGDLLTALGLGHAYDNGTGFPPSQPGADPLNDPNVPPPGGLGGLLGQANVLPGTGSVGDDTVCMMKFNRWTGVLQLDPNFNANDPTSPLGCNDMDFGDAGKQWPGERHPDAGNATPHAMTFIDVL